MIVERSVFAFDLSTLVLIIGLVLLVVLYSLYVGIIRKKNKVKEATSGIDVQLQKRYDLIPNILRIANKFMEHERNLIEEITTLRTQACGIKSAPESMSEKFSLDNALADKMGQLLVNVENYPQLKSDATMMQAMQTYTEVEEHIAAARRFYNSAVNDLNNAVEIFPGSVIAAILNIKQSPFFEAKEVSRETINASDYLK